MLVHRADEKEPVSDTDEVLAAILREVNELLSVLERYTKK